MLDENGPVVTHIPMRTTELRMREALASLRVQNIEVTRDIVDRRGRFKPARIDYTIDEFAEKIADALEQVDREGSIQARADAVERLDARRRGERA
jgi:hypothetical protein